MTISEAKGLDHQLTSDHVVFMNWIIAQKDVSDEVICVHGRMTLENLVGLAREIFIQSEYDQESIWNYSEGEAYAIACIWPAEEMVSAPKETSHQVFRNSVETEAGYGYTGEIA